MQVDLQSQGLGVGWEPVGERLAVLGPPGPLGQQVLVVDQVDGRLRVVWRGVTHAMNVLAGGRGGVDIPEKDKRAVWRHLARHYEQFDEERLIPVPSERQGNGTVSAG